MEIHQDHPLENHIIEGLSLLWQPSIPLEMVQTIALIKALSTHAFWVNYWKRRTLLLLKAQPKTAILILRLFYIIAVLLANW